MKAVSGVFLRYIDTKEELADFIEHENDIVSNTNDYNDNDKNEEDDVDFY